MKIVQRNICSLVTIVLICGLSVSAHAQLGTGWSSTSESYSVQTSSGCTATPNLSGGGTFTVPAGINRAEFRYGNLSPSTTEQFQGDVVYNSMGGNRVICKQTAGPDPSARWEMLAFDKMLTSPDFPGAMGGFYEVESKPFSRALLYPYTIGTTARVNTIFNPVAQTVDVYINGTHVIQDSGRTGPNYNKIGAYVTDTGPATVTWTNVQFWTGGQPPAGAGGNFMIATSANANGSISPSGGVAAIQDGSRAFSPINRNDTFKVPGGSPAFPAGADTTKGTLSSIGENCTTDDGITNTPLPSAQTGTFTVTWDATPSAAPMDATMSLCQGSQIGYDGYACIARFDPTGDIDVRNGGTYQAVATIPYSAGVAYHFRMVVNLPAHTYSVYLDPPPNLFAPTQTVASNYVFRTEQNIATRLDTLNVDINGGSSVKICKLALQPPDGTFAVTANDNAGGSSNPPGAITVVPGGGPSMFAIAAHADGGGSIGPAGSVMVKQGGGQMFTIAPLSPVASNNGIYYFFGSDVQVDGASVGPVTTYTFDNVQANHVINATFKNILVCSTINGSIFASAAGSNVQATITPNSGYTISDVEVDRASVGAVSSCTFRNVQANHTVYATFSPTTQTCMITADAGANGSISPSGRIALNSGGSQTFTITPNAGYTADVVVDGADLGSLSTYTFSNATANHTINATFSLGGSSCTTYTGTTDTPLSAPQTGTFTVTWDATPSGSPINATMSLCQSNQTRYNGYACIARFNPSGDIDARNGGIYQAVATIPYSAGVIYHFRMVVNLPAHTYSVYLDPPPTSFGPTRTLASNYAFRTEQNMATSLDTFNVHIHGGGSVKVCNLAILSR